MLARHWGRNSRRGGSLNQHCLFLYK